MNNYQKIMKDKEVFYLNAEHERIVERHIRKVKRLMYFATETTGSGKYQDFLSILDSIYLYSNNFFSTMVDKNNSDAGSVAEFLFLIPNMCFYTAVGFLTALKNGENDEELRKGVESVGFHCEQTTSELADVLIDKTENDKILKDIFDTRISKN